MRKVVAITGASSGIGRALALSWARRDAQVFLHGRNEITLARVAREVELQGGEAVVIAGDVTKEADRAELVDRITRHGQRLDVLVNNAGRGYYARVSDISTDELEDLFRLNVTAPLRLTQLAMSELTWAKGTVVMMSSVSGVVSTPRSGAYAASKFALEAISMALRAEIAKTGVRVLVVRPGPVDTPFRANAINREDNVGYRPAAAKKQTPEDVAEMTYRAVEAGAPVLETSAFVKLASLASRVIPGTFRWLNARMAEKT